MAKSRAAFDEGENEEDALKQDYCLDPLLEVLAKYLSLIHI